jgi:hypothetical protein
MKTALDCIPCFARQALEAARFVTDDPAIHEGTIRHVMRLATNMDLSQGPPVVGQQIHRWLRQYTGVDDPYREMKQRFTQMALGMLPEFSANLQKTDDPLVMAMRLAIAGNVIDLGVNGGITEEDVRQAIAGALDEPFHGDIEDFHKTVDEATDILYLADNAGEIVFDRLLIEQLPKGRVTVAVRGRAVLNDATMTDAEASGITDIAEVIDNGSDAPGTILSDCSENFRRRFSSADLIIAKGQGNFETLSDETSNIYFLFKAKCPVIAKYVGLAVGTHAAVRGRAPLPEGGEHHAGI